MDKDDSPVKADGRAAEARAKGRVGEGGKEHLGHGRTRGS